MCGIAGIYSYSNDAAPVDETELIRIRESMYRRGPDGAGMWISRNRKTGLAHRRLSIIDLGMTGSQPMSTLNEHLYIVFNGEIYNYKELTHTLKGKGYIFQSSSDTEVLLHLYAEFGPQMVDHLRGMYAFAIWDMSRQGLFLARDPMGIKPLYYSDNGNTFRFASQVKALISGHAVDTTPDPAGRVGFFLWGNVPEPHTMYKSVRSLPAGTSLWIDVNGPRPVNYYFNFTDEVALARDMLHSPRLQTESTTDILHEALRDSVRQHQIADVDVGLFLSAGLDSATLAALAVETGNTHLNTITLGFAEYKNTGQDETILAAEVAKHYSTRHLNRFLSGQDFSASLFQLLDAMDQPSIDGVNTYFVSKVASEAGLKVALSGLGGDELFGGYPSFRDVPRMVHAFNIFDMVPAIGKAFRYLSAPLLNHYTSPKYAGLLEYGGNYGGAYLLRRGMFMPWELPDIMDADMVKEGWQQLQTLTRLNESVAGPTTDRMKVSILELSWYMRNQLLRDADWAGMAHSVEIRVPLVDITLFRNLLPLLISDHPPSKQDMASTPYKSLPFNVLNRPKTGFTVPVREWLMSGESTATHTRGLRQWAIRVAAGE